MNARSLKFASAMATMVFAGTVAAEEVPLPAGYTRLDWIQSSGTQWIDTKYQHDGNTIVDMKVRFTALPNNYWFAYYGSRTANGAADQFGGWISSSGHNPTTYHYKGVNAKEGDVKDLGVVDTETDYVIHLAKNGTCTVDKIPLDTGSGGSCGRNDFLFAMNQANGIACPSQNRLYYCQIRSGATLVRDFIPCRTDLGEVGLWDKANGGFYGNAGTGRFGASEGVPLPEGYTHLEWIQSSGTQWIDTGYPHDATTVVDMKVRFTALPNNYWFAYYGSRTAAGTDSQFGGWINSNGHNPTTYHYKGVHRVDGDAKDLGVVDTETDYVIHLAKNGECRVNDKPFDTGTGGSSGYNDFLFAMKQANDVICPSQNRLYYCQIRSGAMLVRDFIPCRDDKGEVGLWDAVEGEFYDNDGTGCFGTPEGDKPLPEGYMCLNWIQSSGTQWIDTGYPHDTTTVVDMKVRFATLPNNYWFAYYGSRTANGAADQLGGWVSSSGHPSATYHYKGVNGKEGDFSALGVVDTETDYRIHLAKSGVCTVDGKYLDTGSGGSCVYNDFLFAMNQKDEIICPSQNRLYYCQIRSGATLQRDFIPCRTEAGEVGLWDKVEGEFYDNVGTGSFTYGLAYLVDGSTLVAHEGVLTSADLADYAALAKDGENELDASAVTLVSCPLALSEGTYSLVDGEVKTHEVNGALTLKGGAKLAVDITAEGCDRLEATSVDIEATEETPFVIQLTVSGAPHFIDEENAPVVIAGMNAVDLAKFRVETNGGGAELALRDGNLVVLFDGLTAVAMATWIGGDSTDGTNTVNWLCKDAEGNVPKFPVFTADTVFNFGGGTAPKFDFTPEMGMVGKEFVITQDFALDGDRDWSGLPALRIAENVTIDPKGFTFKLPTVVSGASSETSKFAGEGGTVLFAVDTGVCVTSETFAVENPLVLKKDGAGELTLVDLGGQPALYLAAGRLNFAWTGEAPENPFLPTSVAISGVTETTIDLGGARQSIARSGLPHGLHMCNGTYDFTGTAPWRLEFALDYYIEAGANVTVAGPFSAVGKDCPTITVDGGELHFTSTTTSTLGDAANRIFLLDVKNGGLVRFASGDFVLANTGGHGQMTLGSGGTFDARGRTVCIAKVTGTWGDLDVTGGSTFAADTVRLGRTDGAGGGVTVDVTDSTFEVGHILQSMPLDPGSYVKFNGATLVPTADGTLFADDGTTETPLFSVGANGLCVSNACDKSFEIDAKIAGTGRLTFVDPRRVVLTAKAELPESVTVRFARRPTRAGRVIGWDESNPPAEITVEGLGSNWRVERRADGLYVGQGLMVILK